MIMLIEYINATFLLDKAILFPVWISGSPHTHTRSQSNKVFLLAFSKGFNGLSVATCKMIKQKMFGPEVFMFHYANRLSNFCHSN